MKGTKMKRFLAFFMALAMLVGNVPTVFAAQTGLCDHHTAHEGCGYAEAVPGNACTHAHGPECYAGETHCIHVHEDCGYSEIPEENTCAHVCAPETGCVTMALSCAHVHGDCGYSEGTAGSPCGYECRICAIQELIDALPEEVTPENRASVEAQLTAIDEKRLELTDEELEQVDFAKYQAAIAAISALDGMAGAEEPAPVPAATSGTLGDNITWTLDTSTGHLVLTGSGPMKELPGSGNRPWNSYSDQIRKITVGSGITTVSYEIFAHCSEVTEVVLPEGITTIGYSSFENCFKLSTINFPSTLERVGSRAFYRCEALTEAHFSDGLKGIAENAFIYCTNLSSVRIPASMTSTYMDAFRGCSKLKTAGPIGGGYDIEFGWTDTIPAYALAGISSLQSLTLPAGLQKIGDRAFMSSGIREVVIPDGVTYVGLFAFYGCDLEKVKIPASVTTVEVPFAGNNGLTTAGPLGSGCDIEFGWTTAIPARAFYSFEELTEVTLPSTMKTIGRQAFYDCYALESITIPASVTSIGEYAFSDTGITSIAFKGSAPTIETGALRDVTAVATYPADNATWTDSVRKNYGGTITWVGLGGADGLSGQCGDDVYWTIDIATGTMSVFGTGPMWDYDSDKEPAWGIYKERRDQITTLTFSEGITRIGESTFGNFSKLTSLTIPDSVTLIDDYAFGSCSALKTLDLGDGCSLGEGAFIYCPIRELELGKSGSFGTQCFTSSYITSITITANSPSFREGAFWKCTGLKEVHFKGSAPGSVTDKGFVSSLASFRDVTWYYECGKSGWTTSSRYNAADKTWAGYTLVSEGHTYTSSTTSASCTQPGGTVYTCACGDTYTVPGTGVLGHDWSDWATTEATCTADGSRTRSCKRSGCGETETETIPSQGHQEVCELDYEPTCIKDGQWGGCWCANCGKVFKEKEIRPATGVHTFVNGKCSGCEITGGQCGDDLYWTLKDQVLTIYGSGPMYDFEARKSPWHGKGPRTVVIEEGVTSIGAYSFAYQDFITSLALPETVTRIGTHAFYSSENIVTIELPDSLETIESYAFWDCWVKELHLGPKVKDVDAYSFFGATRLENISVEPANPWFSELDGMLMSKDGKTLLVYPAGRRDTTFTVPDSVTALGDRALSNGYLVSVNLAPGITYLPDYLFSGCGRLEKVQLPIDLRKIGSHVFVYCDKLAEITIPARVTGIGFGCFANCESLTKITFLGHAPSFNGSAFYGAALDVYYPGQKTTWTEDVLQDYGGDINWIPYYDDLRVDLDPGTFGDTVWIDGKPFNVIREKSDCYVKLPNAEVSILVTYTFHMESKDPHTQYPTGMRVFRITDDGTGKKAEEIVEFQDLLQYSGSSIRITGNKGIRMITSMEKSKKDALTGAGLAGYTLVEYGTALCWSSDLEGGRSLILGQDYTRSNYAYRKGVADPVFAYSGSLVQYTNVLVGFDNDQCKDDIAMRSYIILEDAEGDQVTLYGGTVHRSIGYIAYQNRAAFAPGSAAYEYVWDIIHHVYGDMYDEDYEG